VFGADQRITSGPAAIVAASRWRQAFTRKQAAYMAAPERFAKRQIHLAPRAPSIHGPRSRQVRLVYSIAAGCFGRWACRQVSSRFQNWICDRTKMRMDASKIRQNVEMQ